MFDKSGIIDYAMDSDGFLLPASSSKPRARRKDSFIGISKNRQSEKRHREKVLLEQDYRHELKNIADHWGELLIRSEEKRQDKLNQAPADVNNKKKPILKRPTVFKRTRTAKIITTENKKLDPKHYSSISALIRSSPYLTDKDLKEIGITKKQDINISEADLSKCYRQIMSYQADYKTQPCQYRQEEFSLEEMINLPKVTQMRREKNPKFVAAFEEAKANAARILKEEEDRERTERQHRGQISNYLKKSRSRSARNSNSQQLSQHSHISTTNVNHDSSETTMNKYPFQTTADSSGKSAQWGNTTTASSDNTSSSSLAEDSPKLKSYSRTNSNHRADDGEDNKDKYTEPYHAGDVVSCLVGMISLQLQRDHEERCGFREQQAVNQLVALEQDRLGGTVDLTTTITTNSSSSSGSRSMLFERQFSQSTAKLKRPVSASFAADSSLDVTAKLGELVISPSSPLHPQRKQRPASAGVFGGVVRGSYPITTRTLTPLRPRSASALSSALTRLRKEKTVESAGIFQVSTKQTKVRPVIAGQLPAQYWPKASVVG